MWDGCRFVLLSGLMLLAALAAARADWGSVGTPPKLSLRPAPRPWYSSIGRPDWSSRPVDRREAGRKVTAVSPEHSSEVPARR
ncbi:MAG: hypothetical protein KF777_11055 [Planctomycetaceae bacterium]|nr:hypothetical protein [Planctomycetaceae bacterium]